MDSGELSNELSAFKEQLWSLQRSVERSLGVVNHLHSIGDELREPSEPQPARASEISGRYCINCVCQVMVTSIGIIEFSAAGGCSLQERGMELLREAQNSLDEFVQIYNVYSTESIAQPEANTTKGITSTPHNNMTNSSHPPGQDEWEQEVLTLDPDDIAEFSVCESHGAFLQMDDGGSPGAGEDKAATWSRSSVDIEDVDGGRVDILMSEVDLTNFRKESGTIDLTESEEREGEVGWGSEEGVEEAVEGLEDSLKEFDDLIEEFKSPDEFLSQVNYH